MKMETVSKVKRDPTHDGYFIDFTHPAVQDVIVEQAISVAQCGLYDGIMFDAGWSEARSCACGIALWKSGNGNTIEPSSKS